VFPFCAYCGDMMDRRPIYPRVLSISPQEITKPGEISLQITGTGGDSVFDLPFEWILTLPLFANMDTVKEFMETNKGSLFVNYNFYPPDNIKERAKSLFPTKMEDGGIYCGPSVGTLYVQVSKNFWPLTCASFAIHRDKLMALLTPPATDPVRLSFEASHDMLTIRATGSCIFKSWKMPRTALIDVKSVENLFNQQSQMILHFDQYIHKEGVEKFSHEILTHAHVEDGQIDCGPYTGRIEVDLKSLMRSTKQICAHFQILKEEATLTEGPRLVMSSDNELLVSVNNGDNTSPSRVSNVPLITRAVENDDSTSSYRQVKEHGLMCKYKVSGIDGDLELDYNDELERYLLISIPGLEPYGGCDSNQAHDLPSFTRYSASNRWSV
jgi:hypothetical protein